MKSAALGVAEAPSIPLRSPGTTTPISSGSATPSQAYSEKSGSEIMSRKSTASLQHSHPPHLPTERVAPVIMTKQLEKESSQSESPASVQEQLSPMASYTPFSDSLSAGLAPPAGSRDERGTIAHKETVVNVNTKRESVSPAASTPEEYDTSRSILVEREEDRDVGVGESEARQEERADAASLEVERAKKVLDHEDEPLAEEGSVRSGSISEHISGSSSEEEEELVEVEQTTQLSELERQVVKDVPPPLSGEQYTESFEEPSSSTMTSPSSPAPPLGELIPPLPEAQAQDEATTTLVSRTPPLEEPTAPTEPQVAFVKEFTPPLELQDESAAATPDVEAPEGTAEQEEDELVPADLADSLANKKDEEEVDYQLGQRVLVGNVMAGTIRYVGPTHFAEGVWVGVEIDLPRGRNNGSIDGHEYFECKPNYGLFAPPQKITITEESPEYSEEEEERLGSLSEDKVSSVAEEIEEEQLFSDQEYENNVEDQTLPVNVDENTTPVATGEESPPQVDGTYSPDFESSPEESEGGSEADDEEERESEAKVEEGVEGFEQLESGQFTTVGENEEQVKEDYQWPHSEEGTRESTPMVEFNHHVEKDENLPSATVVLQQGYPDRENRENLKAQVSETDKEVEKIAENNIIGDKSGIKTSQMTEHPPPASKSLETLGVKSESFLQAPEVANQRSQSATPTPAPPPEFAVGALKEMPIEPPSSIQINGEMASTIKQASEVISEELAQELTNEAYETMHNIWKVKREAQLATKGQTTEYEATDVEKIPRDKEVKLSLEDKADVITDHLLELLLQSETNIACSVHTFRKSQEEDDHLHISIPERRMEEEALSPTSKMLPRSPISREPERPVLSPVPEEPQDDDDEDEQTIAKEKMKGEEQEQEVTTPPISPRHRSAPAKLVITGTATSSGVAESSPPPLSPPSPYRQSQFIPTFIPAADEFSPPGSPPKHLSQASAARVAAGEKTPFLSSQDKERKGLERSTSTESISSLLDSLTIKTAQCMVPSERANVDQVVERSWQVCREIGFERLHSHSPCCPIDVLDMFSDLHELSLQENHCRKAYLELVFNLTVEALRNLHVMNETSPVWTQESAVRSVLAPEHKNGGKVTLEKVQKRVYKALMRGQLPSQLPAVKFLRGMKRPGGREIDFVDTILIKELREEEPGWIDYCCDEACVKMKTADAILDTLISETVQVMCDIGKKRRSRQNNTHS